MIRREMSNNISGYRKELTDILDSIKNGTSNDDLTISRIKALNLYGEMYNMNSTSLKKVFDDVYRKYSLDVQKKFNALYTTAMMKQKFGGKRTRRAYRKRKTLRKRNARTLRIRK